MNNTMQSTTKNKDLQIMIIDDDEFQVEIITHILNELEFKNVTSANDGDVALHKISRLNERPDLLICDLSMPSMDGFELMNNLSKFQFKGGVIIVSGQGKSTRYSASLIAQLSSCNYLGELEKPVSKYKLQKMIEKMK